MFGIKNLMSRNKAKEDMLDVDKCFSISEELIRIGRKKGYITSERVEYIPELLAQADSVCEKLLEETRREWQSDPCFDLWSSTMSWAAYAGIGSVFFWNKDRKKFLQNGIVETLTSERGLVEMDEYVLDSIGIKYSSDKGKELFEFIIQLPNYCVCLLNAEELELSEKDVLCTAKSMFLWGMVFEINRLHLSAVDHVRKNNTELPASLADTLLREKYGRAWLLIAGKKEKERGLQMMHELDEAGFVEGSIALSMFCENLIDKSILAKKAADAGNPEGLWTYCNCLPHSEIPDPELFIDETWEKTCLAAAEKGSVDAMLEMGNVYRRRGHFSESMYWYAMANACGHPEGKNSMKGIAMEWVLNGCPREYVKGSPQFDVARHQCAVAYLELNSDSDITSNPHDFSKMVDEGVPIAGYFLGELFKDMGRADGAYQAYDAIASHNDAHALKCCAEMLSAGNGVQKNAMNSVHMYKRAAELGDREAMRALGVLIESANKDLAAYWYGVSHTRGYGRSLQELIRLAQNGLKLEENCPKTNNDNSNKKVVWRDKDGKVTCPGPSACPDGCDDDCPIFHNTEGLALLRSNKPIEAIEEFRKAVSMAPDFYEFLNNLASAYGMSGQHQKAYECFTKTLELKKDNPKAIHGLMLSAFNIGKFDEALQRCDEYERITGTDMQGERAEIMQHMQ